MNSTRPSHAPPSLRKRAFSCPRCHAFAQQHWYESLGKPLNARTPQLITERDVDRARQAWEKDTSKINAFHTLQSCKRSATGVPHVAQTVQHTAHIIDNVFLAKCQNCEGISIWIYDKLTWPRKSSAPPPNDDLPDDVRELYDEARNIVEDSSRGATALLRLSIQILCKHLGQPGKNVNKDIATLVTDGLEPTVQKALDAVRVVGNNAVHPGQIDMRDNTEVATSLFALINVIADRMITQPKRVEEVYQALPKDALDAIARRDKKQSRTAQ